MLSFCHRKERRAAAGAPLRQLHRAALSAKRCRRGIARVAPRALSRPGEVVEHNGVRIVGHRNVPSRVAVDASQLYARNLYNFLSPHIDKESGAINLDPADETVSGTQLTRDGAVVLENLIGQFMTSMGSGDSSSGNGGGSSGGGGGDNALPAP